MTEGAKVDPDVALMLRVRDGDEEAFGELVDRYHSEVRNLAWRYISDRQWSEDIAQETFLRVHKARARYEPRAKFRTWLLRIATNLCISRLRKKRIKAGSLSVGRADGGERELLDAEALDPALAPEQAERVRRVRQAVADLPERQRMAIILNRFHGHGYADLEKALEMSRPAVKSLLHRARESLKKALEAYMEGC